MKLNVSTTKKAAWLVATAVTLNVTAWAANIDYPGWLKVENFDALPAGDNNITGLTSTPKYIANQPDSITFVPTAHWARPGGLNDYGSRVTGFLIPVETADYVFFVAADDSTSLYLSTDATPANLKLVAADQGWQNMRAWTGVGGSSSDAGTTNVVFRRGRNPGPDVLLTNGFLWVGPFENRSDEFLNSPRTNLLTSAAQAWPNKDVNGNAVIHLVANQRYYLELLFREGGGGDYTSVAWKKAGDPDPVDGDPEIDASVLLVNWPDSLSFTKQPASVTVGEGQLVTFSVQPLGVPGDSDVTLFSYQWYSNNVPIFDGTGNARTYNIVSTTLAHNGSKYKVEVTSAGSSPAGVITATSAEATLTVLVDNSPPSISKVVSSDTFVSARITFSEAVQDSAIAPANYVFNNGLTASDAIFQVVTDDGFGGVDNAYSPLNPLNRVTVVLLTTTQTEGATYSLTVNNVKDLVGKNLTPNTATMYANVFRGGILTYKRWNVGKNGKATLEADPLLYANPAVVETVTLCERTSPSAPEPGYVALISGFFVPPVTTNYVFFTSQDADNAALIYLSTDANPANRKMLCAEPGWQNAREWTGAGGDTAKRRGDGTGGGPFENRSDQMLTSARAIGGAGVYAGLLPTGDGIDPDPWPVLDANGNAFITLTAGARYSFQQWQTERDGGQQSATYKYVGPNNVITEPEPANGTASRLTGNVIGALVDPSSLPPQISVQPTNVNFTVGGTIIFSRTATSLLPATNQWFKNDVAIAGQTGASLTINNATASDMGSYHVVVGNDNGTVTSTRVMALTTFTAPGSTYQQDVTGLTVIEAEHYFAAVTAPDGHLWVPLDSRAGFSGTKYMAALPDSGANVGSNAGFETNAACARLNFRVAFAAAGTNYLWLRAGDPRGDGNGDSVHAGFQGTNVASATQFASNPNFNSATTWNWSGTNSAGAKATLVVEAAGTYTVNILMREDGFLLDKLLLTTDSAFVPTGNGPAESQLVAGGVTPTISIARSGGVTTITYTGTLLSSPTVNGTYLPVAGASGGSYAVPAVQVGNQFYRAQSP